jgi:hypothetical protein
MAEGQGAVGLNKPYLKEWLELADGADGARADFRTVGRRWRSSTDDSGAKRVA